MELDDVWVSLTLPQSSNLPLGVCLHSNTVKSKTFSVNKDTLLLTHIRYSSVSDQVILKSIVRHTSSKLLLRRCGVITSPLTCGWRSWLRTRGHFACVGISCTQRNYPRQEVAREDTAHSAEKTGIPEQRRDGMSHTELLREMCNVPAVKNQFWLWCVVTNMWYNLKSPYLCPWEGFAIEDHIYIEIQSAFTLIYHWNHNVGIYFSCDTNICC